MASRPFASVAVTLDVGGDREELLQVRIHKHKHATVHADSKKNRTEKISLLYGSSAPYFSHKILQVTSEYHPREQ